MPFYGAILGALVRVTCPKCSEVQVRSRRPPHERIVCRKCGHSFEQAAGAPMPPSVRDRRR